MRRRSFLAGLGASLLATPFCSLLSGEAQAGAVPARRLLIFFSPNGTVHEHWRPSGSEEAYSFPAGSILEPLTHLREHLLVLGGLDFHNGNNHEGGMAAMLTNGGGQSTPTQGKSIDQYIAAQLGGDTRFPSLELGVQTSAWGGNSQTRMCYAGPGTYVTPDDNPHNVWSRMFEGLVGDASAAQLLRDRRISVLDLAREELQELHNRVGVEERLKLQAHMESLFSLEQSLGEVGTCAVTDAPMGSGIYANENRDQIWPSYAVGVPATDRTPVQLRNDPNAGIFANWAYTRWGASFASITSPAADFGIVARYASEVDEIAECPTAGRTALIDVPDNAYTAEFDQLLENRGVDLAFDYTMLGGAGGARTDFTYDVIQVSSQGDIGPTETWTQQELEPLFNAPQAAGGDWARRYRNLPIFIEEDGISNAIFPDGISVDNDSITDRHGGQGYMMYLDLSIERGQRWGILGPNGAGKTTLVRCLLGEMEPDAGTVSLGTKLSVGYFRQSHEAIDPDLTVVRYLQKIVRNECPDQPLSEQAARNLAGAFLFSGESQEKELGLLSGGERARAALAGLMASAKNVLVLDEPTNHLDIPSAERLEEALRLPKEGERNDALFDGTLILISHDRALLDACCDQLIVLDGAGNARAFNGNYSEWHAKQEAQTTATQRRSDTPKPRSTKGKVSDSPKSPERERRGSAPDASNSTSTATKPRKSKWSWMRIEQLEEKIAFLEQRIAEIDKAHDDPDIWTEIDRANALTTERDELKTELEGVEAEWLRKAE